MQGWLEKLARSGKWQRRYFVLHGHYLKYYNPASEEAAASGKLGTVNAAYNLYQLNAQKPIKVLPTMDSSELLIAFSSCESQTNADGKVAHENVETVFQLRCANDAEAQQWQALLTMWHGIESPSKDGFELNESGELEPAVPSRREGWLGVLPKGTQNAPRARWKRVYFVADSSLRVNDRGPFMIHYPDQSCKSTKATLAFNFKHLTDVKLLPLMDGGYELLVLLSSGVAWQMRADSELEGREWLRYLRDQIDRQAKQATDAQKFFTDAVNGLPVNVTLERSKVGLGLRLESLNLNGFECVIVDSIVPNTPASEAHEAGQLRIGDVLLEVNGKATLTMEPTQWSLPFADVLDMFAAEKLDLRFGRTKLTEEEVASNVAASKLQAMQRGRIARRRLSQTTESTAE